MSEAKGRFITSEYPCSFSIKDFKNSVKLAEVNRAIHRSLETGIWQGLEMNSSERDETLFIYFLVVDSLVCNPEVVISIYELLISNQLNIDALEFMYSLEVKGVFKNYGVNFHDGESRTTLLNFFVSPLAIGALHKVLQTLAKSNETRLAQLPHRTDTEERLLNNLNQLFLWVGQTKTISLRSFCY